MRRIAAIGIVGALLFSCASRDAADPSRFEKADLFGMIYDEENQPCPGVMLRVDGKSSGPADEPVSDIRGRFVIPGLSRGEHSVTARKVGFEEVSTTILFLNRTDVLFLRMVSFAQLLGKAEKALEERRWGEADDLLARAERLDPGSSVLVYLKAVAAYKTGHAEDAADQLAGLVQKGIHEPAVYLFLADVYEHGLADVPQAIQVLEQYLAFRADEAALRRLESLRSREAAAREGEGLNELPQAGQQSSN